MADSTDDLCLWGYGYEAILDVLEDAEEVEEQFAVLFRNLSVQNLKPPLRNAFRPDY